MIEINGEMVHKNSEVEVSTESKVEDNPEKADNSMIDLVKNITRENELPLTEETKNSKNHQDKP